MSLFACPACLRIAIRNLGFEYRSAITTPFSSNTRLQPRRARIQSTKRHHATYDSLVTGHHRRALRQALSKGAPPPPNARRKGAGSLTRGEIKDALARENNRKRLLNKQDATDPPATAALAVVDDRRKTTLLKREIEQYYSDPLQLANAVTAKLRIPDFAAAIALVRASEGIVAENVVSWNHCIDWCMSQGDTQTAWKLYNELKKRGHFPDSYTYMIMLRGFSQNARKAGSAQRALTIYNSMSAPNSRVAPGTMHTNAVLNVCARAGDMASMWAISGSLPEKGAGKPDRWTYTTILNAVRENATSTVADLLKDPRKIVEEYGREKGSGSDMDEVVKSVFDEALSDGRKLWAEVSYQWRRAGLVLDEQVVCAMGRLILGCGTRKDFGDVFQLVDSTMNIRLAERGYSKGTSADVEHAYESDQAPDQTQPGGEPRSKGSDAAPTGHGHPFTRSMDREEGIARTEPSLEGSRSLPTTKDQHPLPFSEEQVYATPSNNTLSMVLKAAIGTKDMRLGRAYWHYLTTPNGPFKIAPDAENIISYLRLLRVSRASKDILDLLSRDWPAEVAEKLYRRGTGVIAMSACIRDKNNPNVFDTADKILTLMQNKLEEVQLGMYNGNRASENDRSLTFKERKALAKARVAAIDDVTFGEDEALSELQRTKSGVESSLIDPKALKMYMELAMLKTPGWNEGLSGKSDSQETFERDPSKNLTVRALRRLGPETVNIMRLAKMKVVEAEVSQRPRAAGRKFDFSRNAQLDVSERAGTRVAEKVEDMVDLLRSIVSAHDRVIGMDERFEELGLPRLDSGLVGAYRDQKRRYSGFLSRTKSAVQTMARGTLEYSNWRDNQRHQKFDSDDNDNENDDFENVDSDNNNKSQNPPTKEEELPELGRQIQRIYHDADKSLGRFGQHGQKSRRQRQERAVAVQTRLRRRLGLGATDLGMVGDDLRIRGSKEVIRRVRERVFGNRNHSDRKRDNVGKSKEGAAAAAAAAAAV